MIQPVPRGVVQRGLAVLLVAAAMVLRLAARWCDKPAHPPVRPLPPEIPDETVDPVGYRHPATSYAPSPVDRDQYRPEAISPHLFGGAE